MKRTGITYLSFVSNRSNSLTGSSISMKRHLLVFNFEYEEIEVIIGLSSTTFSD